MSTLQQKLIAKAQETKHIETLADLRKALKSCKAVFVQPRWGMNEKWLKVTKVEAKYLIEGMTDDEAADINDHSSLATIERGDQLYIG